MKTLETIAAAALAALVGCEAPKPSQPRQPAPEPAYVEPNTIRLRGNGAHPRLTEPRKTIIVNEQHPYGVEISEDGTVRGPLVAPVQSITVVLPPVSYPDGVPKSWAWEEQGNWYRSPDRRFLWIDGAVRQSLEAQTRKPDHETIPHGSEKYAPRRNRER